MDKAEEELRNILTSFLKRINAISNRVTIADLPVAEELLAWHSRHAGRPSREQIMQVLERYGDIPIQLTALGKQQWDLHQFDKVTAILALWPSQKAERKVSREEIEKCLMRYVPNICSDNHVTHRAVCKCMIDDLLALLSGGEREEPVKSILKEPAWPDDRYKVCGAERVLIRGRRPGMDRRWVCPTCLQEHMDDIRTRSDPNYGSTGSVSRPGGRDA